MQELELGRCGAELGGQAPAFCPLACYGKCWYFIPHTFPVVTNHHLAHLEGGLGTSQSFLILPTAGPGTKSSDSEHVQGSRLVPPNCSPGRRPDSCGRASFQGRGATASSVHGTLRPTATELRSGWGSIGERRGGCQPRAERVRWGPSRSLRPTAMNNTCEKCEPLVPGGGRPRLQAQVPRPTFLSLPPQP